MKRWLKYALPYWQYFIIGPLCMIVEVVGEVVMPKLLSVIINMANNGTLTVAGSAQVMTAMIITAIVMMAGGVGGAYFGAKASVNFAATLRADLYLLHASRTAARADAPECYLSTQHHKQACVRQLPFWLVCGCRHGCFDSQLLPQHQRLPARLNLVS